jgi:hypothetical protein
MIVPIWQCLSNLFVLRSPYNVSKMLRPPPAKKKIVSTRRPVKYTLRFAVFTNTGCFINPSGSQITRGGWEHVSEKSTYPSFEPTLQMFNMSPFGDSTFVNPVPVPGDGPGQFPRIFYTSLLLFCPLVVLYDTWFENHVALLQLTGF